MQNVGSTLKIICDLKYSQESYFLTSKSQRLRSVGNLETIAHRACPKTGDNVIGTESEIMCLEAVMAVSHWHDLTCGEGTQLTE